MKQPEEYYYQKMDRAKQAAYRVMLRGLLDLADEIQIPQIPEPDGAWLYDVFFQLRLDHLEILWATGFKYRYFLDSTNLIFVPEYMFEKNKIREHQKALAARVEKLVRPAAKLSELEKNSMCMILSVKMCTMIS